MRLRRNFVLVVLLQNTLSFLDPMSRMQVFLKQARPAYVTQLFLRAIENKLFLHVIALWERDLPRPLL